jgi:Xaa-Pro aminopeptidase
MDNLLSENNIDALMINFSSNIGYLSDFWGSFGIMFFLKNGEKILISDSRYSVIAEKLCKNQNILYKEISNNKNFFNDIFTNYKIKNLGIESNFITLDKYLYYKEKFNSVNIVKTKNLVETLRIQKTEKEAKEVEISAKKNDDILKETLIYLKEGVTEKSIAWTFEKIAKEKYDIRKLSFDPIVAFGENSAVAHHSVTNKKLEESMPILIDCGVTSSRYCSDMTRSFWYGERKGEIFEEWLENYNLVFLAQKKGIESMVVGEKISNIEETARNVFKEKSKFFTHTFGHGVGINIHESPTVSIYNKKDTIKENMVITAEPGLYFKGKYGIRIEDLLLIKKKSVKYLSNSPYQL